MGVAKLLLPTIVLCLLSRTLISAQAKPQPADAQALAFFESKIRPLFAGNCFGCHSSKAKISFAGLQLDSASAIARGAESGPVIIPGDPDGSSLIRALRYQSTPKMPPGGKLSDEQINDVVKWVKLGAPWPQDSTPAPSGQQITKTDDARKKHWAWQPVAKPAPPAVKKGDWPKDDIDRFVLARLESEGLAPNPDADPATLVRRLYFDLTGLPPSYDDVKNFLADSSPAAYEKLVDRLLSSPAYGQRWGRHWLDQTYYADNIELGRRVPAIHAWRYRDYVIDSFNHDTPYPQFVKEQMAGDLLETKSPMERRRDLIATGFLALGPWSLVSADKEQLRMDVVDLQVDLVGRSFLGLTLGCARCHDHKFDPIPNKDYYGLAGIFRSTQTLSGRLGLSVFSNVNTVPLPELPSEMMERAAQTKVYNDRLSALRAQLDELTAKRKSLVPPGSPEAKPTESKDPKLKELDAKVAALRVDIGVQEFLPPVPPTAHAVQDIEAPTDCQINIRGNAHQLGPEVPRHFVSIAMTGPMAEIEDWRSGRSELADWIGNAKNPMTARVAVNRIWHHLFGAGIVRTIDNFGLRGDTPSHPELLDYLAQTFVESGWSHKKMIRRIVLTHAYRLSGVASPAAFAKDPEDRLLWRVAPRRLEAEAIHDAVLAISGKLDSAVGGPSLPLLVPGNLNIGKPEALKDDAKLDPAMQYRRAVYQPVLRKSQLPELDILNLFNFPDVNQITGARVTTIIPTQALYLMNAPFLREQAEVLASTLLSDAKLNDSQRAARLVMIVFNRPAAPGEVDRYLTFLADFQGNLPASASDSRRLAWIRLCHSFFASNEFLYRS